MLLHKVEAWRNISLLHLFSKISEVQLFKSDRYHKTRSSFYLVAKNVKSEHELARDAVRSWQRKWRVATFGTEGDFKELLYYDYDRIESLLEEFGAELIELGRRIWAIEGDALANAWFTCKLNDWKDDTCADNSKTGISSNTKIERKSSLGEPEMDSTEEPKGGESSDTNDGYVLSDVDE